MRRRVLIWAVLVLATVALSACAALPPSPAPNAVIHYRNLSGSALVVGTGQVDSGQKAILRPCGDEASFSVPNPPADDPRVFFWAANDSTGNLDAAVSMAPAGTIDPDTLGQARLTGIIWSRGNIDISELPQWITFRAGTIDQTSSAPTDTAPPHCDPWPNTE